MDFESNSRRLPENFTGYQLPSSSPQPISSTVTSILRHEIDRTTHYFNAEYDVSKANHENSRYQKRPRRKADEIERLYSCNWDGCSKAYGTLTHLNTHVGNAKHGPKRERTEFEQISWARKGTEPGLKIAENYRPNGNSIHYVARKGVETDQKQAKPLNAFMLYRKDKRMEIMITNERNVSRVVGNMWKRESPSIKAKYHDLAIKERERHKLNYLEYECGTKNAIQNKEIRRTTSQRSHVRCEEEHKTKIKPVKSETVARSPSEVPSFLETNSKKANIFEQQTSIVDESAISSHVNSHFEPSESSSSTTVVRTGIIDNTLNYGVLPNSVRNSRFLEVSPFIMDDDEMGHRPPTLDSQVLDDTNLIYSSISNNPFESQPCHPNRQQNDIDIYHTYNPFRSQDIDRQLQQIGNIFTEQWNWEGEDLFFQPYDL